MYGIQNNPYSHSPKTGILAGLMFVFISGTLLTCQIDAFLFGEKTVARLDDIYWNMSSYWISFDLENNFKRTSYENATLINRNGLEKGELVEITKGHFYAYVTKVLYENLILSFTLFLFSLWITIIFVRKARRKKS